MQLWFVVSLSAMIALAGCTEAGEPAAGPTTTAPAPEPTADAATGALTGTIVNDEQEPISGAMVSVVDGPETRTDASGTYTINGLDPRQYTIIVASLGYEQTARKVDVLPGEITKADFMLKAIIIAEVYQESFSRTGMVTGQWTVNYLQNTVNNSAVDQVMCGPCSWVVEFQPGVVDAVTDVMFKPNLGVPAINEVIIVAYNKNLAQGQTYSGIMSAEFKANGATHHWSDSQVKNLKGVPKARLQLHGPDPDNPGIAFQQKVELWQTFAFGDMLPEGFTLLPPR